MLDIKIKTVPEASVRAEQSGDWWYDQKRQGRITVSVVGDTFCTESELAIAIHELVEAFLCRRDGVTEQEVVDFDTLYESERKQGRHHKDEEPGDDPRSPYRLQHAAAIHVERAVCLALDLMWKEHELALSATAGARPKRESLGPHLPGLAPGHPLGSSPEDQPCNH